MKIKILIVDDSNLMRGLLTEVINTAPDLEVVGTAADPLIARELIKQLNPDVLTLDVEMPRMDGLDFLERLMRLRPTPVVMISSLTERGSTTTLRALELGAVDFMSKPRIDLGNGLIEYAQEICEKIRMAHSARHHLRTPAVGVAPGSHEPAPAPRQPALRLYGKGTDRLIAIGASTGGTEAIKTVLSALPEDSPPIVMVQHMPESFTASFAQRLDALCRVHVKEARDGEVVLPGHAYLAPGHSHLMVKRRGSEWVCELSRGAPVNRHRPSVDVLFDSVAQHAGKRAVGVILTGMGKDGAKGMRAMRDAGAYNIAQDERSCIVYGMPREAVAVGAVQESAPLDQVAQRIVAVLAGIPSSTAAV